MAEICSTEYVVIGKPEDMKKFADYIARGKAPADASEMVKKFFDAIQEWSFLIMSGKNGTPKRAYFKLDTKYSPEHKYVGAAIYAAVGHRMDVYYNSWCLGCADYRTNDKEHTVFRNSRYVWDFNGLDEFAGQDEFASEEAVLERAEDVFEQKFASIDDVNRYARETYGNDVVYPYQLEEPDFGWEELETADREKLRTYHIVAVETTYHEYDVTAKSLDAAKAVWEDMGNDETLLCIEDENGEQTYYSA